MDSLQLLALYLTLTHIFSGGKAKINLHTTPKLTVVMSINCPLQSIKFPSPQNDTITSCSCNFVVCCQPGPAIKSFLELTDCCLVYPTFFAIRLGFLQSLNAFRHQSKRMTSVFMQIRLNFPDISYLSETQKNNFQFLSISSSCNK